MPVRLLVDSRLPSAIVSLGRPARAAQLGVSTAPLGKENCVMSAHDSDHGNDNARRAFLAQVGASTLALLGAPALLSAESILTAPPMDDKWLDNLKGRYRQACDAEHLLQVEGRRPDVPRDGDQ